MLSLKKHLAALWGTLVYCTICTWKHPNLCLTLYGNDLSCIKLICYMYQMYFVDVLNWLQFVFVTNRFQVSVHLFSNRSQLTSKCGKNKKVAHEAQPGVSLMLLPHFVVLCDLLLNRCTATWNLSVLYNRELRYTGKKVLMMTLSIRLSSNRS